GRKYPLFLIAALPSSVILPVQKQIKYVQITQIPLAPSLEVSVELLSNPADSTLAQTAFSERLAVQILDVLGRKPSHVHSPNQPFQIYAATAQPLHQLGTKPFLGRAQLRNRQLHQPRFTLDSFRFVAVSPSHPQPSTAPVMLTPQKRRGLLLDGHLQNVLRQRSHEPAHGGLSWYSFDDFTPKQSVDLFLHPDTRWYSLHGVDLLPAPLLTESFVVCFQSGRILNAF